MTLLEHIQSLNRQTKRALHTGIRGGSQAWAVYHHEDIAHWNSYGVFTPDDFDRYQLATDYYEVYREVYGFKPNWSELFAMSVEQLKAMYIDLTTPTAA